MIDVAEILPAGAFAASTDQVVLDHDHRMRRRIVFQTTGGRKVRLNQTRAVQLRDGDGLRLTSGEIVRVEAEPEPLLEITAPSRAELIRIAWHLGNRHLPTQLLGEAIRIRADHVIAAMVEGLGGAARPLLAPFDPEGGAYEGGGHHHHHDHEHSHEHSHD